MTSTPGHQKLVNVHLFISHRPLSNKSGLMARIQLLTENGQIEKNKRIFKVLISRRFFKSLLSIENNEHPVKKKKDERCNITESHRRWTESRPLLFLPKRIGKCPKNIFTIYKPQKIINYLFKCSSDQNFACYSIKNR